MVLWIFLTSVLLATNINWSFYYRGSFVIETAGLLFM